jgi:hypothetical protein
MNSIKVFVFFCLLAQNISGDSDLLNQKVNALEQIVHSLGSAFKELKVEHEALKLEVSELKVTLKRFFFREN